MIFNVADLDEMPRFSKKPVRKWRKSCRCFKSAVTFFTAFLLYFLAWYWKKWLLFSPSVLPQSRTDENTLPGQQNAPEKMRYVQSHVKYDQRMDICTGTSAMRLEDQETVPSKFWKLRNFILEHKPGQCLSGFQYLETGRFGLDTRKFIMLNYEIVKIPRVNRF